jgi:hypothetical protein
MPGGQPSTTHPIAGPWLSPKEVTQNNFPSVLPDTVSTYWPLQLAQRPLK